MCTPAVTTRPAQTENDASLVLEAEHVALAEVEQYKCQTLRLVAASWLRAELVHKRTEARISRLRERMAAAAQVRQLQIGKEMATLAGDTATDGAIPIPLERAIARVVEELAGISETS